jgi:hypothetical protein
LEPWTRIDDNGDVSDKAFKAVKAAASKMEIDNKTKVVLQELQF